MATELVLEAVEAPREIARQTGLCAGVVIEDESEMTPRYRAVLLATMKIAADLEVATLPADLAPMMAAPSIAYRIAVVSALQDEKGQSQKLSTSSSVSSMSSLPSHDGIHAETICVPCPGRTAGGPLPALRRRPCRSRVAVRRQRPEMLLRCSDRRTFFHWNKWRRENVPAKQPAQPGPSEEKRDIHQ
jgi:hypothetical protein